MEIKPYNRSNLGELVELNNGIWILQTAQRNPRLLRLIEQGKVVMAFDGTKAIGYGAFTQLNQADDEFQTALRNHIHNSNHPEERAAFLAYLTDNQRRLGKGEIVLDYYKQRKNQFLGRDLQIDNNDLAIFQVGVNPRFRNRDIGTGICEAINKISKGKGSTAIYLESMPQTQSFFEKQGYTPFFRYGPYFHNGSPATLMGMKLRR